MLTQKQVLTIGTRDKVAIVIHDRIAGSSVRELDSKEEQNGMTINLNPRSGISSGQTFEGFYDPDRPTNRPKQTRYCCLDKQLRSRLII